MTRTTFNTLTSAAQASHRRDQPQPVDVVLALDASSTTIGYVVLEGGIVRDRGTCALRERDINERCRVAYAYVAALLRCHPDIDVVAIESPVARFAKAVIPQAFVSGAIRTAVTLAGLLILDVEPATAKKALAGAGNAAKDAMMTAAVQYGLVGCTEHEADAYAVALVAARRVRKALPS
jgi:Holliday junction resolvasome RuvABC endonuclease subunit